MAIKKFKNSIKIKNPYKLLSFILGAISLLSLFTILWVFYSYNDNDCYELSNCPKPKIEQNQNTSSIPDDTDSNPNWIAQDVLEKFKLIIPRNNIPQGTSYEISLGYYPGSYKTPENYFYIDRIESEIIVTKASGYATETNGDPVELHYDLSRNYSDLYSGHSKIEEASFFKLTEDGDPIKLDTTFSQENQEIVSKIDFSEIAGYFGVFAPLKCPGHPDEPSNNRYEHFLYGIPEEKEVFNNESDYSFEEQIEQYFDVKSDQDWFNIIVKEGKKYIIEATGASDDVIPFISIYGGNIEEIAAKRNYIELDPDDEPYLEGDRLIWIKLEPTSVSTIDCDSKYTLVVREVDK